MTYFRRKEWFTSLACIFISTRNPISRLLNMGMEEIRRNAMDTRIQEYENELNGNELEMLMSICVMDASHHDYGNQRSNFKGQSGINFLKNLICNLRNEEFCRRYDRVFIHFDNTSELETILDNIHVPFLFPANCKLPSVLLPCSRANSYYQRTMHVGTFERTLNNLEIDAKFHYFRLNEGQIPPNLPTCSIECKYWRSNVLITDLTSILTKFLRQRSSKFGLIICNTLGGYEPETLARFNTFRQTKKINLYKLTYLPIRDPQRRHFSLHPYHESCEFIPNPKINCIILELSEINS